MADSRIAKERYKVGMPAEFPARVIAREDGTVWAQNAPARRLMGEGLGKPCWDVVGGISGAEGLPCAAAYFAPPVRSTDTRWFNAMQTPVRVVPSPRPGPQPRLPPGPRLLAELERHLRHLRGKRRAVGEAHRLIAAKYGVSVETVKRAASKARAEQKARAH